MESSPRYNSSSPPAPTKLRLMCSTGGHIVPRPHDKSLCYIGGETRILAIDRHTTLLDLTHRLFKTILRSSQPASSFTIKYQLPSEDLDSLITVTTDEDLENMIDEYERLNSSSRLRLFIFPTNPASVLSIGTFLENSGKSEDWFVNALNGTSSVFSDTSSVNCLLDLDDEIALPEKKDVNRKYEIGSDFKQSNSGQEVHSILDSPVIETSSSFGSASSTPSLSNLPPIRVNENGGSSLTNLMDSPAPAVGSGSPASSATAIQQSTGFDFTITDHNKRLQQKVHSSAYLPSMPTTERNSPRHQLHTQQPQLTPPIPYIHVAAPVTCYYQQPTMNQQNFMYYIPADTPPVAATANNQAARTSSSGGHQLVRVSSGYQNQVQHVYYATQEMKSAHP